MRHFIIASCLFGTRGPLNARISHRSGDIAAAAAAAAAAQSTADGAATAASTAQSAADAAQADADAAQSTANDAQSAATDIGTSLATTGLAMVAAPSTKTGTGSVASANLTVPSAITLTNGKQYGIEGVIGVRKADGTVLMMKKVEGVRLLRSGGNFSLIAEGDERMLTSAHADLSTYFTASDRRPAIGFDGANITLDWRAESAQEFVLEFDGSIADLGIATV